MPLHNYLLMNMLYNSKIAYIADRIQKTLPQFILKHFQYRNVGQTIQIILFYYNGQSTKI